MPYFDIHDGILSTQRFGDRIQIAIPARGRVEIHPGPQYADVEMHEATGAVVRRFRLPEEQNR
jgi:hypothetical protein